MASHREEEQWAALRRSFTQAFTSLELGRRRWAKLSEEGKRALSHCTNSHLKLHYAEGEPSASPVRRQLALRALQQQQRSQDEARALLAELEGVLVKMQEAVALLRRRVEQAEAGRSAVRDAALFPSGLRAGDLLGCLEGFTSAYAREMALRRELVRELCGGWAREDVSSWESGARLALSAWVMQPYIEDAPMDLFFEEHSAEGIVSPPSGNRGQRHERKG
ncbi:hypothetical protein AB1Y20_015833 [Prymnesium parvum]|uniref:Uncharacterized protein n=1 Tax=Prymnesium parvum TaxID=97485 RepID=A0AB34K1X3_PRYPA